MPTTAERDALVLRWRRLPAYVRFRLMRAPRRRRVLRRLPRDEALAVGALALVIAAARWEPCRGPFATLACKVIARHLCHAAREWCLVRVPESTQLCNRNARPPARVPMPAGLAAGNADPCEAAARADLPGRLRAAVAALSPRRRVVLRLRILEGRTLREVAGRLSVTCERVRQLEADILSRLGAAVGADRGE